MSADAVRLHDEFLAQSGAPWLARRLAARADLDPETASALALVVSELVTNAVRFGTSAPDDRIAVELLIEDAGVYGSVTDSGDGYRPERWTGQVTEHGMGLGIVGALASSWGVDPSGPGSAVWFRLPPGKPL
jgi:two-component sensor histidine kinase